MRRSFKILLFILLLTTNSCSWFLGSYDGPVIVSHGYVEGVTPADTEALESRTYPTVQANWNGPGGDKVWLAVNLGAAGPPANSVDESPRKAGWYFQFNRKQGYHHTGTVLTPQWKIQHIDEDLNWEPANDPCRLLLGDPWRIPTRAEMAAFLTAPVSQGGMAEGNRTSAFNSDLNMHAGGYLHSFTGDLIQRGDIGSYWSSDQAFRTNRGEALNFGVGSTIFGTNKAFGRSVRCIKGN